MTTSLEQPWLMTANDNDNNAPFQRNSNIYWTLQSRSSRSRAPPEDVEALYSTPNKNRNQLKTTPLGFDFFSPVAATPKAPLNEGILEDSFEEPTAMSPIDPRNAGAFTASTPQQMHNPNFSTMSPMKTSLTEDLRTRLRLSNSGIRSHGNSPISSGRSTPSRIFEPQQATRSRHSWSNNNVELPSVCSDRLGTPKTSLMDFKKLLLNKNTAARPGKISAVEALRMSREKTPSPTPNSSMNILDLSGSPKTFATRRMIRQGQFGGGGSSPSKQKHTNWRGMRTDVISTAIPEAAVDEEQQDSSMQRRQPIEIVKSPEIVIEEAKEVPEVMSLKENLFMKQQENNFTTNEIREHKKSAMPLQQQRAHFLFGASTPEAPGSAGSPTNNNKTAVFKSGGHYTGIVAKPANANLPAPSLETAL